jgi:hypothetical protein
VARVAQEKKAAVKEMSKIRAQLRQFTRKNGVKEDDVCRPSSGLITLFFYCIVFLFWIVFFKSSLSHSSDGVPHSKLLVVRSPGLVPANGQSPRAE